MKKNIWLTRLAITAAFSTTISTYAWAGWLEQTGKIYYTGGNVGIGTTTPEAKLDIAGGIKLRSDSQGIIFANAANNIMWREYFSNNDLLFLSPSNIYAITLKSSGNVGIGETAPTNKLSVGGNADFSGNVGIGTTAPTSKHTVAGIIETTNGGIKFPDGTTQATAASNNNPWAISSGNISYRGGNVGIGTATPGGALEVSQPGADSSAGMIRLFKPSLANANYLTIDLGRAEAVNETGGIFYQYFTGGNSILGLYHYGDSGISGQGLILKKGGNIGIGTTTPDTRLDVVGSLKLRADANNLAFANAANALKWYEYLSGNDLRFKTAAGSDVLAIQAGGNVGIGTVNPSSKLTVNGVIETTNGGVKFPDGSVLTTGDPSILCGWAVDKPTGTVFTYAGVTISAPLTMRGQIIISNDVGNGGIKFPDGSIQTTAGGAWKQSGSNVYIASGKVGIGTSQPSVALEVSGETKTSVITITGGADVAEPFKIEGPKAEPGMVVCIDPANSENLKLCAKEYDKTVAGVLSGAGGIKPGLQMSQKDRGDAGEPVALVGRVFCYADADYGAIEPGDLLTTSNTAGHARKVTNHNKARGAILGKALTGLAKGKGLVKILVTLQ